MRDAQGKSVRLLGISRDITQRKKAEQALAERDVQLALAGKAALVGSYTYDISADSLLVSESYPAIHGLPEGELPRSPAPHGWLACTQRTLSD
jgi:PAS domain-containing protein